MKIIQNPDSEYVKEIRKQIKANNGYCPCQIEKSADTKCMCTEFRNMVDQNEQGMCHCGLYISVEE